MIFGSVVTATNITGYAIAFIGVIWYNYLRMPRPTDAAEKAAATAAAAAEDGEPQKGHEGQVNDEHKPLLISGSRMAMEVEPGVAEEVVIKGRATVSPNR